MRLPRGGDRLVDLADLEQRRHERDRRDVRCRRAPSGTSRPIRSSSPILREQLDGAALLLPPAGGVRSDLRRRRTRARDRAARVPHRSSLSSGAATRPSRYLYRLVGLESMQCRQLDELLRTMARIRAFEERVGRHFRDGDVHGFVHVSIGQEAVAAGACARARARRLDHHDASRARALHRQGRRPHRDDGRALRSRERPLPRQGRLHAHRRPDAAGSSAPTGSSAPASRSPSAPALAARVRGRRRRVASRSSARARCTPARSTRASTLAVALAAARRVRLREQRVRGVHRRAAAGAARRRPTRAEGYGMPAERVDGNDVLAVRRGRGARRSTRARAGGGPALRRGATRRGCAATTRATPSPTGPRASCSRLQAPRPAHARAGRDAATTPRARLDRGAAEEEMDEAVESALAAPYPRARRRARGRLCLSRPTYLEAINRALRDEMARDERGRAARRRHRRGGRRLRGHARALRALRGERVLDTPIAEAGVLGAAVGAAMAGLRPVAEIMYMDFITVCLDPIVNQAAKLRYMTGGGAAIPIVFRTQTGGGRSGGAQHSQSLEAMLAHVPGLRVFCPSDARDAYDLLVAAIRDDSPVCFVENRRLYPRRIEAWDRAPLAARPCARGPLGRRCSPWSAGGGWSPRRCAALASVDDVSAELIDLRTLVPLDLDPVFASVRRTGRCLVVHEAVEAFGAGAEIAGAHRRGGALRPRRADRALRRPAYPGALQPRARMRRCCRRTRPSPRACARWPSPSGPSTRAGASP